MKSLPKHKLAAVKKSVFASASPSTAHQAHPFKFSSFSSCSKTSAAYPPNILHAPFEFLSATFHEICVALQWKTGQ